MRSLAALPLALGLALVPGCFRRADSGTAVAGDRCVVASVTDGDTIRCSGGLRVRLIGIDSPEMNQGRYGGRARTALLQIISIGRDRNSVV